MDAVQRKHFRFLLLMAFIVFVLLAFPNAAASKNSAMVQVFSADEAAPLPALFHMIAPTGSLVQSLKNFIFYSYYPYGFVYFALSAIVILPLQWLGLLSNTTIVMLVLRQMVSVLPMLAAILILVYMQDGFRTYRSYILFIFLACIPAVVQNNLWWHPDGLVTLFVVLTLFFLVRDRLRFGVNFHLAAIVCGLAVATKLVGLYFFLAVGLTLVLGIIQKKLTWPKAIKAGLFFILLMVGAYFVASPFWLSHWERTEFIDTMRKQSDAISSGYGLIYAKGLLASWPLVHQFYGEIVFFAVMLGCLVWGALRGVDRLKYALITAWFIPLSVMVFYFSHFKFQYWLPAVLPAISCIAILLPQKLTLGFRRSLTQWLGLAALVVIAAQFGLFLKADIPAYHSQLTREVNDPAIAFHADVISAAQPILDLPLSVYFDPNMYMPPTGAWTTTTTFDLLTYAYISENKFDVVMIEQSRINDYLNPNAVGIDPSEFAASQQFYRDADQGTLTGYRLIYQNAYGKLFASDALVQQVPGLAPAN